MKIFVGILLCILLILFVCGYIVFETYRLRNRTEEEKRIDDLIEYYGLNDYWP